jgi:hypothetical protein
LGSGSAPSIAALAALLYVAAHGARAPLLALMGLRRPPNLVLIAAPYAVTVPLAFAVVPLLGQAAGAGLVALVLAPGALGAPLFVSAAGGRRADLAGALSLGTVIASVLLVATRPDSSGAGLTIAQAFLLGMVVGGAVPSLRELVAPPLRWGGHVAGVAVIALAAASGPALSSQAIVIAVVFAALVLAIAITVALTLRRDVLSAGAAAGTRDPIVATFVAWSIGGADATAVPLVNAVILGIVATAVFIRHR